jgi:2-polyprenyl-6-methoxyphenol hydroxylase-like FAD-dependent oxidoreductase
MKILVIGAGPAGLYFSLLARKRDSGLDIHVVEQNPAGATYGWGVVFSDVGLSFLKKADPDFFEEFTVHHERCDYMEIVHQDTRVQVHGNHFSRTSRIDMLRTLHDACEREGIRIEYGRRVDDLETLRRQFDLVVAADGGNSTVRTRYADAFQPVFEKRRNKFAWYGTRQRFHPVSLIFRQTQYGVFVAHSYQYSPELSTFLVEVSPEAWQKAGLDRMSEDDSRRFCADVFRRDLGAHDLLTNRSLWFEANIVRNANWHHENVVLLGDSLRTVHFSLGSGTRMAMQDAIALDRALAGSPDDLRQAFVSFKESRGAASATFQQAAARSLDWYEKVDRRMHLDPLAFAYDYMRRTGQVTHDDLALRDPHFIGAYESVHGQPSPKTPESLKETT